MLTHTDIHFLVGLLTKASGAEEIEVELGDRVFDAAGNKPRDVDITVKQKNADGTLNVYKGIEVKDELKSGHLGIQTVEQLCLKLDDMPEITHKAIVSTTGYSSGAVSKATAHHVELLEMVDWDPVTSSSFENIILSPDFKFNSGIKENIVGKDGLVESILHTFTWKMLSKHTTKIPIAACGITSISDGTLHGFCIIGAKDKIVSMVIHHSDRGHSRIYKKIVI